MASKVVSDNFETSSAGVPQLGGADRQSQWCKAWVSYDATGTVNIRASYNVSSITDNGTGKQTTNFSTSMPSTSYSWVAQVAITGSTNVSNSGLVSSRDTSYVPSTSSVYVKTANAMGGVYEDMNLVNVQVFSN